MVFFFKVLYLEFLVFNIIVSFFVMRMFFIVFKIFLKKKRKIIVNEFIIVEILIGRVMG